MNSFGASFSFMSFGFGAFPNNCNGNILEFPRVEAVFPMCLSALELLQTIATALQDLIHIAYV